MARAKFKIGTLVQFENDINENAHGVVDAVITYRDSYAYRVNGEDIAEDRITNGFRPITTRTTKAKKSTRTTRSTAKAEASEARA